MIQLRCKGSEFFDENADFCLNTPEGIAGLQWIKDNYDKGYYPAGCENMVILDCEKLFLENKLGLYIYNVALGPIFKEAGIDIGYVNFPGADSHGVNSNWITGFMAFDNGDEKKIEVIKDFLSYIYNSKELMDYSASGLPCSRNVAERWHDSIPMVYAFTDNEEYSVDFTMNNPNWGAVREAFYPHIKALLSGEETAEQAAKGIDADCNLAIYSTEKILHE
jgi:ABC-type sugar transport system, periplasmic component